VTGEGSNLPPEKQSHSRVLVKASTDVNHFDDGYVWKKYGQKNIKGTTSMRFYYHCSEKGCPAKKQAQQMVQNLVLQYTDSHNHLAPGLDW